MSTATPHTTRDDGGHWGMGYIATFPRSQHTRGGYLPLGPIPSLTIFALQTGASLAS